MNLDSLINRIKKNKKQRLKHFSSRNIEAWRLYEHDIPEGPFVIDVYGKQIVLYDKRDPNKDDMSGEIIEELSTELSKILPGHQVIYKARRRQDPQNQYERLEQEQKFIEVQEGPLKFYVNLHDYLDTGLYIDQRKLRSKFLNSKNVEGKKLLNLYSYTSSVSVAAALAGIKTVNVDLSKNYLYWSTKNFELNNIDRKQHEFIANDGELALEELNEHNRLFDFIYIDPPTFSNSKKKGLRFSLQDSHKDLLEQALRVLAAGGELIFSGHMKKFKLDLKFDALMKNNSKQREDLDVRAGQGRFMYYLRKGPECY